MALQFILSDESVNNKDFILDEIYKIKKSNPQAKIYYLVPDNIKFDMERYVLNYLQKSNQTNESAMINLQVVSFSRLAWFLLPESNSAKNLSQMGVSMLIRQLLYQEKDQLIVFRGQVNYQGFVDKLTDLFDELYQGNIMPSDLTSHLEGKDQELNLDVERIKELAYLYEKFLDLLDERDLANYASYQLLLDYIQKGHNFSDYYIVIDHHDFFNSQQLNLILAMAEKFNQVWVNLPISYQDIKSESIPLHLSEVYKSYQLILGLAYKLGIEVDDNIYLNKTDSSHQVNMINVANQFIESNSINSSQKKPVKPLESNHHFLGEFDLPQSELRAVSNQIHYLVSQEGYRYKDILILARNLDTYKSFVGPIFELNDIPVFFDQAQTMDQHPFSKFLESYFSLVKYNFDYTNLTNLLKNPLFLPKDIDSYDELLDFEYAVDVLENIILANGYTGYRFYDRTFEWNFQNQDLIYVNRHNEETDKTLGQVAQELRNWFLGSLEGHLPSSQEERLASQWARGLYQAIDELGIIKSLEKMRDYSIEKGELEESRQHEQVWQLFVDLLDEFYEIYQDQIITYDLFTELVLTGLKEGEYHIIPPTIDQVTFQSLDNRRVQPYKVTFVLGLNEFQLPKSTKDESLLSSLDREIIANNLKPHQYLLDFQQMQYSREFLLAYRMMLSARDQLYLSYSQNDGDKQVGPSPYIKNLTKVYDLPKISQRIDSSFFGDQSIKTNQIGREKTLIAPVLRSVRQAFYNNQQVDDLTLNLIQVLRTYPDLSFDNLLNGIFNFSSLPENIQPQTAQKLYGKDLILSVSRIEKFYQDPYSHFLLHGLKIQERDVFSNDVRSSGNYFHDFMDIFAKEIIKSDRLITDYSQDELRSLADKITQVLTSQPGYQIYNSNPRMLLIRQQMDRTLIDLVNLIKNQSTKVNFKPRLSEAQFGYKNAPNSLKGFKYSLSSGGSLTIRGKIDRIDEVYNQSDNKGYLQVVDYKSTKRNFNPTDVYYGLDLQLLTYLSVALKNYPDLDVFGAFYQNIIQEHERVDKPGVLQAGYEELTDNKLKNNQYSGVLMVQSSTLSQIEPQVQSSNSSLIYPARLKKDGSYTKATNYLTEDDYKYVDQFVHEKFKEAGELIHSGEIRLAPYYEDQYTTSLTPKYRVITGFDATENYQAYRHKEKINDPLEAIKDYLEKGGQDLD